MKTTSRAIVVEVPELRKIEGSDHLSFCQIDGYNVVVRSSDWFSGGKAVFIPPENIVDVRKPEFAFLRKKDSRDFEKIKVIRLRGVISAGVLIPALADDEIGSDVTERLGIVHDDPEAKFDVENEQSASPKGPLACLPKYDIDSFAKIHKYFKSDQSVVVTEKIHGQNSRFVYSSHDNAFHVGARGTWQKEKGICWSAVKKYPQIEEFCRKHPDLVLCGEVFGQQGGVYRYGLPSGNYDFRAFDIRDKDFQFVTYEKFKEICKLYSIPMVPEIYIGNYKDLEFLKQFAEGNSEIAPNVPKEGCVVKSYVEKRTEHGERMVFKIIGSGYKG